MRIDILTLFPESFKPFQESIISRAQEKGALSINVSNIRDFSKDKHKKCDDTPFGGGVGMVMSAQPVFDAVKSVSSPNSKVIYPSPGGKVFNASIAKRLAQENHLIFICGHYEGIDQRLIDIFNAEEISIGDYVLTGGEIPTMVIVDSLSRFVPGVLSQDSLIEESFSIFLLEYPQYTRPQVFEGLSVPEVLLSGNHKEIAEFRFKESLKKTKLVRPDLIKGDKFEN